MKIYTKTGDRGETGLFAGPRVRKDDLRIEAYGAVDELNSALGVVRAEQPPSDIDSLLQRIQNELFAVGAELATPDPAAHGTALIQASHVEALELAIDRFEKGLAPLRQFILPGGTKAAAALHMSRTVCRRAERRLVTLIDTPNCQISEHILRYLNRLGDLLFVLARAANADAGHGDIAWQKP
jgi:cob(I)alamin adenosyltransferase